jgi:Ca2+-binding RTX toxin-like protein
VFSNVLLNQGPDFDLSRRGAAATARSRRLGALAQELGRPQGRTRAGTRRDERLFGGRRHDHLFAGGGDDRDYGRRGHDVLLQGARGNDRILGGRGDDNIDGHCGRDVVSGGPGKDQPVDFFGDTAARTGSGNDLVAVRDGHDGDTVVCWGPGRKRILADPGDPIVGTVTGPARAVDAHGCSAGSRVITDGPLPRYGSGY